MTINQPENQTKKYEFLFSDIDSGILKIPKFQRDFVWTKDQAAFLIDSIIKGYPIGTFIFWQTKEELRHFKEIGNANLPPTPIGDSVKYVLDGQQRITALYAVKKGVVFTVENKEINYKDICINLEEDVESEDQYVLTDIPKDKKYITVYDLLNNDITDFLAEYSHQEIKKIDIYKKRLTTYDFSTIMIVDYPLDIACDIFTRINTGGTELTLFEIMVAKTYDIERDFDLSHKYQMLVDSNNNGKDLEDADYDTLPPQTILQCVSACLQGQIKRRDILKSNKDDFISIWDDMVDSLFLAVDWTRSYLRIPVSALLPYNALMIPLTYFFYKNNFEQPDEKQSALLQQYFYWAALTNRFSSAVESKIEQDLHRMDDILDGNPPSYRNEEVKITMEELKYKWFSTGDAFCKAILCLYAYNEPKRFDTNALVKIDNSWLKQSTSKNYHHFFPKAHLQRNGVPYWKANTILNITIVDDYLNKRKIRSRSPKEYISEYKEKNKKLSDTMKTHLILDLEKFGIWDDDYERFLEERGKVVLQEIESILNPEIE